MTDVSERDTGAFFKAVDAASRKAVWCALASVDAHGAPRVRMVHPTWEGEVLWVATGPGSPKFKQMSKDPRVDVQFQVSPPDFTHILCRGNAQIITDAAEKERVWSVFDYDLAQFWPGGPTDPNYALIGIRPVRVELSKMFGTLDKQVWRRRK